MTDDPITIELLNPPLQVHVNERVPLQLVIKCPHGGRPTVLRAITPRDRNAAELDSDLFERDLPMAPGEVYRCSVNALFRRTGSFPEPMFVVNAGQDTYARAVRIPTPPIRVLPSLLAEMTVKAESICTYDQATKVDVTITHKGHTRFADVRLSVGPVGAVLSGVSEQRRPVFGPKDEIKFTTVVASDVLTLEFDATVDGEQVGPAKWSEVVPPVRDSATAPPFCFLEPKKLSQADVRIYTLDEDRDVLAPESGVYDVHGGGTKYRVEIEPKKDANASAVRLQGLSGSVEVTDLRADPGVWAFQMLVVSDKVFTSPVAIHIDVTTPEGPQQGELNLAVRPRRMKHWAVAITAGIGFTAHGAVGFFSNLFDPADPLAVIGETLHRSISPWDLLQLLSIPIAWCCLRLVDRVVRVMQDG